MKIDDAIKKFGITLAEKDGQPAMKLSHKPTEKQLAELMAAKPTIIVELQRQAQERQAKAAERRAQAEIEKAEYLATADLRRYLVGYQDEYGHVERSILTLLAKDGRAWQPQYGATGHHGLTMTDTMTAISAGKSVQYGLCGVAWEIIPEQEDAILAEQIPAAEKADQEAQKVAAEKATEEAARKAEVEAARQAKFEAARATREPVMLKQWAADCIDPREECSTDIVTLWAMPDGTTQQKRQHTW